MGRLAPWDLTETGGNRLVGFRGGASAVTIGISGRKRGTGCRNGRGQHRHWPGGIASWGELLARLDEVVSGSGRLFLLAGDPGIGKSRLAREAAARARDRGIKVAWGRCWEAGGAPAYWPWVQSLRACVRGAGSEELRSQLGSGAPLVAQIVAEVAEILVRK